MQHRSQARARNQIRQRIAEVKADWEQNYKEKVARKPRILITGCPNGGVRDKTIKVLEELGADVVAFDTCNSNREKIEKVDISLPVAKALAKKYLNINCSVIPGHTAVGAKSIRY